MPEPTVQCGACGEVLVETVNQTDRLPCPQCGSTRRCATISVTDKIELKEQLGMKRKDPSLTGKQKIRIEQLVGDELHRESGKWYKKVRIIDRQNDRYVETVTDPETGTVIHSCEEPLSEHYGHGSAKIQS